ncbi:hypothetical protein O6H91_03G095200 [Diphasiastrum complanatum]|uniref:Uncharacterized protein n=1 Tax=Diphasiastrum complanatum TaxID=34168 RepID=A0ACC2E9H4_DIPCM|nr:hypothetical protein O6H91_03G095200 [Diphasiastrum complanatum]
MQLVEQIWLDDEHLEDRNCSAGCRITDDMGCALGTQSANPKCFLDIAVEDKIIGPLVIVLRIDVLPKTAQNKLNTARSNTTGG